MKQNNVIKDYATLTNERCVMRSLFLILKILLAAALVLQSVDVSAASKKVKHQKKSVKKTLQETSDVWGLVRAGMQIPRYFPEQTVLIPESQKLANNAAQLSATKNTIKTASATPLTKPILHHDENNRTRLRSVLGRPRLSQDELEKQNAIVEAVNTGGRVKTTLRPNIKEDKLKKEKTMLAKNDIAQQIEAYVNNTSTPAPVSRIETKPSEPENTASTTKQSDENNVVTEKMVQVNPASERIGKHIEWYAQRPSYLKQVAERASPYLYHIVNQLTASHLPPELALLPIVESAYQPTAESPKSAAGLWQFIPSTGLDFDLTQTEQYDKRLDIEASTQAAARYLGLLKRHYNGDWLLALAAYNCGQGRVDDAIAQNQANGLPTNYWALHLPEETQEYVPRFLALATIFSNPKAYRLNLPVVKNQPYFVKVNIKERFAMDYLANKELTDIAQLAALSPEQFTLLNPGYLKSTVATDQPFSFLLPVENAKQLNQHLDYVAHFITDEPKQTKVTVNNAPLKDRVPVNDTQKSLPIAIIRSLHDTVKPISPLLSLNLMKQTPPRIEAQPLLFDSNTVPIAPSA